MQIFDILGEIVRIFFDMVPRFCGRPPNNHVLVVDTFLFGSRIIRCRPVLHVPILDHAELWPTTEQSVNSEMQSLETADGESVTVDVGFSYKIRDHILLRQELGDEYVTRLSMIVRGEVRELINGHNWSSLCDASWDSKIHHRFEEDIAGQFDEYGVDLTYLTIEDLTKTANVRHFGMNLFQPVE